MNEAGKAMIVMLPAGQYRSELVQPGEQALDLPMPFVAPQDTTILRCGFRPVASVRCDQLDTVGRELVIEQIAVAGMIPGKSFGESKGDGVGEQKPCTASGRPAASAMAMSFVPLPRLVLPTLAPLFSPPRTCHRPNGRPFLFALSR
jgi:hypothetical protein